MNKITVKEWIKKFNNGEFDKTDYETQCAAGWYDWFCSDYALAKRLKRMRNRKDIQWELQKHYIC